MSLVTYTPAGGVAQASNPWSYVNVYPTYTMLKASLELQPFYLTSTYQYSSSLSTVYDQMTPFYLFNTFYVGNIAAYESYYSSFYYAGGYMLYVAQTFALEPIVVSQTPRQVIEGYTSSFLTMMASEPIYELGDATLDPWISLDTATYTMKNNQQVKLNSGENDYTQTAMYQSIGSCASCNMIMVPCKQFLTLTTTENTYCNPYSVSYPVGGTSGNQFQPLLLNADTQTLAVPTISIQALEQGRMLNFTATSTTPTVGTGNYAGFNLFTYNFTEYMMNAVDKQTIFVGMTDISTLLGSPAFVTLANYTGISTDYSVEQSMAAWTSGVAPPTNPNSAMFVVEEMSGRPVETTLNFMYTYAPTNDYLMKLTTSGWTNTQFFPYANIDKSNMLNLSQVSQLLGYQSSTRTTETIIFIVLLVLGLGGIALGVMSFLKFQNAKKLADVTSGDRV